MQVRRTSNTRVVSLYILCMYMVCTQCGTKQWSAAEMNKKTIWHRFYSAAPSKHWLTLLLPVFRYQILVTTQVFQRNGFHPATIISNKRAKKLFHFYYAFYSLTLNVIRSIISTMPLLNSLELLLYGILPLALFALTRRPPKFLTPSMEQRL